MNEFEQLGLSKETIEALEKKGYTKPTPIQERTIPILLKGEHDVIGQAQTGTGKTACFALPILENIIPQAGTQAVILAPTRELAVQVTTEIKSLAGNKKVRVGTIYGGASMRDQLEELKRGLDIVVGTPGRVMDLIKRKRLNIADIQYAVLDEADEMLNMGFVEDIEFILKQTPVDKKMLFFSATMPKEILRIAKTFMREYEVIEVEKQQLTSDLINQYYLDIHAKDRYAAIKRIIASTPDFHGVIFCKTRAEVDQLAQKVAEDNLGGAALHGDISQDQREKIIKLFKAKKLSLLIATDVAARGIDVNDLNVVINYSLPQSPEIYTHRIGRTGRAGKKGTAITFLIPSESRKLRFIEKIIDMKIPKGELPSVQQIIKQKKIYIQDVIEKMLEADKPTEYDGIAHKLLHNHEPFKVVSAVLRYSFMNELDENSFKNIDVVSSNDRQSEGGRDRDRSRRDGSRSGGYGRSRDSGRSGGRFGSRDNRSSGRSSGGFGGRSRDSDERRGSFRKRDGDKPSFGGRSNDIKPSFSRDRSDSGRKPRPDGQRRSYSKGRK